MRRLLRFGSRVLRANFRPLDFPMKLTLNVTDRCNSRCITCDIWNKPTDNELTFDEIRRFFQKSNGFSWLDIIGGEAFLRSDIGDIMEVALRECRSLYLFHYPTNGLSHRIVPVTERLLKFCPPKFLVTVSLDGDKEQHEYIRGVPNSWGKTLDVYRQLRRFQSRRFRVVLGMTLSSYNVDAFDKTFEAVRQVIPEIQPADFHLNVAQMAEYYGNVGALPPVDSQAVLRTLAHYRSLVGHRPFSVVGWLEDRYQTLVGRFMRTSECPLPCQSLSVSCYLDAKGNVHPCLMYVKPLGNLREYDYDLHRIWTTPEAVRTREEISRGICPHCWTPCEAYQTIFANVLRFRKPVRRPQTQRGTSEPPPLQIDLSPPHQVRSAGPEGRN